MEEEEIFPFETSMDGFLRSNFTSMEQECALLHQPDAGVNDNRVQPEVRMDDNNDATTHQAAVRVEFVSPTENRQGTTAWATEQHKQFDRDRSLWCNYFSEKEKCLPVYCLACFSPLYFCLRCLLRIFPVLSTICRSRYERRYELFGCTGCVNCCTRRRAFTIPIFRR